MRSRSKLVVVLSMVAGVGVAGSARADEAVEIAPVSAEGASTVSDAAPPGEPVKPRGGVGKTSVLTPLREPAPAGSDVATTSAPAEQLHSTTMILVGSILSGVGAVSFVAGGALVAQADSANCSSVDGSLGAAACESSAGMDRAYGTAFLVAGGLNSAVGIPLIAVGSQAGSPGREQPAAQLGFQVSGAGATIKLSF